MPGILLAIGLLACPLGAPEPRGGPHGEPDGEEHEVPPGPNDGETFAGTDRRDAKTSLSTASPESFRGLTELLASLPSDDRMRAHSPPLERDPGCARVAEEQRNVVVQTWLYAAKKEEDNDYHLILGSTSKRTGKTDWMTAEVSGLPAGGRSFEPLRRARAEVVDRLGHVPQDYKEFDPPLKLTVAGSLFYDVDHSPGSIGPQGTRPETAWEIHPVSNLVFSGI